MAKVEIWIIIGYFPNSAIAAKLVDLEWHGLPEYVYKTLYATFQYPKSY